ncbi:MAG: hypothetical protein AB8G22_16375 [Saprospiraceae bacterium]
MMKLNLLLAFLFCSFIGNTQEKIHFSNPSFEDAPRHSKAPRGWYDCGNPSESPPDVHPTFDKSFGVSTPAQDGETYLGLVVRDNDTQEAVGKKLDRSLEAGNCYQFSIYLAQSPEYVSLSRNTSEEVNYKTPAVLRIWGGNNYCEQNELLGVSDFVAHADWREYTFSFQPEQDLQYINLEAYYELPALFVYNGHLLIDNMSPISVMECDSSFLAAQQSYAGHATSLSPPLNMEQRKQAEQVRDENAQAINELRTSNEYSRPVFNSSRTKEYDSENYRRVERESNLTPVWELDEVPDSRLPWKNYDIMNPQSLNKKEVHLTRKTEPETDYLRLFAENFGEHILVFIIDVPDLKEEKKIKKNVLREAKYWDYPSWAFDFRAIPWQVTLPVQQLSLPIKEVHLSIEKEKEFNYFHLFWNSYNQAFIQFFIHESDVYKAKKIREQVIINAENLGYPRKAYEIIKM